LKLFIIFGLLATSLLSFSQENFGVEHQVNNKVKLEIKKIFNNFANTTMNSYNKKRFDYKKNFLKSYIGDQPFNSELFPKQLPKMYFKKNQILIPKIGFKVDINNFLQGTFSLKGETLKVQCSKRSDCFKNLMVILSKKERTSLLSSLLNSAYADDLIEDLSGYNDFNRFVKANDTSIFAVLIHYNNQTEAEYGQISEYSFFSGLDKRPLTDNLFRRLSFKLDRLNDECRSTDDGRAELSLPGAPGEESLEQLIATVTDPSVGGNFMNSSDSQGYLEDFVVYGDLDDLNEISFSSISCSEIYRRANNEDELRAADELTQDQENRIQEQLDIIEQAEDGMRSGIRLYAGCSGAIDRTSSNQTIIDQANQVIAEIRSYNLDTLEENKNKFCQSFNNLKSCLGNYYVANPSINNNEHNKRAETNYASNGPRDTRGATSE